MARTFKSGLITISLGNHKVGDNVGIFNLPAGLTCRGICKGCYALQSEAFYPGVLPCRMRNLEASYRADFVGRMVDLIRHAHPEHFRPHESGDFYSPLYAGKWEEICDAVPSTTFYALSKSPDQPRNFHVVQSILPGGEINYGSKQEMLALAKKYKAAVCPYRKGHHVVCMKDCFLCLHADYIVFTKH